MPMVHVDLLRRFIPLVLFLVHIARCALIRHPDIGSIERDRITETRSRLIVAVR